MINRLIALVSAFVLTACGFTPLHAPAGLASGSSFKNVTVETIETGNPQNKEAAFHIKQRLRDRIGTGGTDYILRLRPTSRERRLGVSDQDVATRFDLSVSSRYEILDARTGDSLDTGSVRVVTTYGAPLDPYGREAAQSAAIRNVSAEAADRLMVKLAGFFANQK